MTTIFAVVLGVAFVAGSYVLTDTIFAAFDEIFSESLSGTSVVITAENPVKQENGETPTIPASVLPTVQKTRGVRLAAGAIFTPGGFFNAEGEKIGNKFAPKFISSTLPGGLESLNYVDGHHPRGPREASIDQAAAEDGGLELGERIELIGQGAAEKFRLVGFTRLGSASFGGASIAQVTLPVAQRLTHKRGRLDQISVAAADGVSAVVLKRRIAREMPGGVRVETAKESADRSSEEIRESLGFLQTFLLVFGFIAVFVGSFLIFNTFSITVAQRVSEFGMLRTLGASRRQILSTVMVEAGAIGLLGALLGIAGGFAIAAAIEALFKAVGIDLPTTTLQLQTRTIVVALLVGVLVTLVSSLLPALRSTRVPPIAALHAFTATPSRRRRLVYLVLSVLLGAAGIAMVLIGLLGSGDAGNRAILMGGGAVAVVFAVSIFSPRLVPPLATLAGWALERVRPLTGRLARENAQRNPSRTAITAAALMIGLALVAFVTVFAAGLKSTVAQVVDENFAGGLVIQNSDGFSPIPNGAAKAARKVPGVASVSTIRGAQAEVVENGRGGGGARQGRRPRAGQRPNPGHRQARQHRMEAGRPEGAAQPQRPAGDRLRRLRLRARPPDRRQLPAADPDASAAPASGRRRVQLQARRPRQRPRHPGRDGSRLRPDAGHLRLRRGRKRGRCGEGPGAADARVRNAVPGHRSLQPAGTEGKPRRT